MPSAEQQEINAFGKLGVHQAFLDDVNKLLKKTDIAYKPIPDCWLLPLPNGTPVLSATVSAAQKYQIPHRVLYFDNLPSEYSYVPPKP
jgi:hypothetical protein